VTSRGFLRTLGFLEKSLTKKDKLMLFDKFIKNIYDKFIDKFNDKFIDKCFLVRLFLKKA
jgi:hypothetical protein